MRFYKTIIFSFFFLCLPGYLVAWEFNEHRTLGEQAFLEACKRLNTSYDYTKSEKTLLLKSVPCADRDIKARQYGIRSALAGDHVELPEDFESVSAERQALSYINYGELALKNYDHFWPHVKTTWRKLHYQAIDLAIEARELWLMHRRTKALATFDKALVYSAFADHFLQDAFSIGHNGFSRVNSLQNPSLTFHDEWNKNGRLLKGKRYFDKDKKQRLNVSVGNIMDRVLNAKLTCKDIAFKGRQVKQEGKDCGIDIWLAHGDGELNSDDDNRERIIETNTYSIVSVMLAFIDGEDRGYSLLADSLFPVATQSFEQKSAYTVKIQEQGKDKEIRYTLSQPDQSGDCPEQNGAIYEQHNLCWFDVENSFMEPVYPDITVGVNNVYFKGFNTSFYGAYLAYTPYTPEGLFSWIPKNIRLYFLTNLVNKDLKIGNNKIDSYRELGASLLLPNFYGGTPIYHEIDIAYAWLSRKPEAWDSSYKTNDDGFYLGLNTNAELLKAKISLGTGWYISSNDIENPKFKLQLMVGYDFGVIGGGPLTRWE